MNLQLTPAQAKYLGFIIRNDLETLDSISVMTLVVIAAVFALVLVHHM